MRLAVIAALMFVGPARLVAQVLPQIEPSGSIPNPTHRLANTAGNQVTFTVTNLNGGTDGQVSQLIGPSTHIADVQRADPTLSHAASR